MKTPFLLAAALTLASTVCGQIYAPDVAGHDIAQRIFPVEMARLLAWQRNTNEGAKIAEVTYQVETTNEHETVWTLRWMDGAKKPLRERTVRYPETLLAESPGYFREVFKQVVGDDWAMGSAPPDNAASAYWLGADQAGVSRLEAVGAASKWLVEKPKVNRAADATRLAGILIHGALPSAGGARALDGTLLARGAAWLCTAEALAREPLSAAWAPLIYLTGHTQTAQTLWKGLPAKTPAKMKAAERLWDCLLRGPTPKDCFLFAARSENRAFVLPALLHVHAFDGEAAAPLAVLTGELVGSEIAGRLYDYAPIVAASGAGWTKQLPAAGDAAWLAAVRGLKPAAGDFDAAAASDAVVLGHLSERERSGSLIPVAHVTGRDLLGGAWESAQPAAPRNATAGIAPNEAQSLIELVRSDRQQNAMAAAKEALDPAAFKNADEFWTHLEAIRERSAKQDHTSAAVAESMQQWLKAALIFVKAYPQDARRWDAKVTAMTIQMQLAQFPGGNPKGATPDANELAEILAAPDATAVAKGEAAYLQVILKMREVQPNAPHTFPPFHRAAEEYLTNFPTHPRVIEIAGMMMQLLQLRDQPGAENVLKRLATHRNEKIADMAKAALTSRERLAKLRSKPLELKVPATDGREIDFVKLRGKVVLIDFWASWCGPCIAELPNVVKTYEALHAKGFEIVGISLDQDRDAMDRMLKKHGATWPQNFDGSGWKNAIAQQFGVTGIPSTWLFDKKGILRETELRGEELQAAVEKLLRE